MSVDTTTSGAASEGLRRVKRLPRAALIGLLWIYQKVISPLTGPTCRYYPSCSQYALVAVQRHGALRGTWLAVRRLGRCHPWTPGGVDDVPPAREPQDSAHDHGHADRSRSRT